MSSTLAVIAAGAMDSAPGGSRVLRFRRGG